MFEYLEPDASDDQGNSGTGSLPLPPRAGATSKGTRSLNPEKVRHMLFGSLAAIDRTIKILHALGYADPNDWSEPVPVPPGATVGESLRLRSATGKEPRSSSEVEMPAATEAETRLSSGVETWTAILTKTVLIE